MYQRRRRSTRVVPIRIEPTHQVDICDYKKTYKKGWFGTQQAEEQQAEIQQAEVQNDDNEMDVVVENIPMQVVDDDPVNEAEVRALDGLLSLLGSAV